MDKRIETCGDCHTEETTTMVGFCSNPNNRGSRSSAMFLCDECTKRLGEKHRSMGKIGQIVICPISPSSIKWHDEANAAPPQKGKAK